MKKKVIEKKREIISILMALQDQRQKLSFQILTVNITLIKQKLFFSSSNVLLNG